MTDSRENEAALEYGEALVGAAEVTLEVHRRDDPTDLEGIGYDEENLANARTLLALAERGALMPASPNTRDLYGDDDRSRRAIGRFLDAAPPTQEENDGEG